MAERRSVLPHIEAEYTGLSSTEANRRLIRCGRNTLNEHKKKSPIAIFFSQFADVMTIILIACTAISVFMGDRIEACVMIGIVVVNAILSFAQEFRTEKTIEALRSMTALSARVLRDGKETSVPSERIVPGDVVFVRAGDIIPADGFIIHSAGLMLDESMLTGESEAVCKDEGTVYGGTQTVSGSAAIGITDTGMAMEMGKISSLLSQTADEATPLQKRLASLGRVIVIACAVVCVVVSGVGILRGQPVTEMLMAGISLAVAAVPEGLPAIVTISLALGVQRLCERNALVRKLSAVETLGSTGVICSDKTGTLTQNRMTLRSIVLPSDISGVGTDATRRQELRMLARICKLCNNGSDATEKALKNIAEFAAEYTSTARYASEAAEDSGVYSRIYEFPFDSKRKCMSVAVRDPNGNYWLLMKGGADIILGKCRTDAVLARKISLHNSHMASQALRVLGVAWRQLSSYEAQRLSASCTKSTERVDSSIYEHDMIFGGFCGLIDPPRPEAAEAIRMCKEAGIRTVMITGDHKNTAGAIARELSILPPTGANGAGAQQGDDSYIMTGEQIEAMSDDELESSVDKVSVFARVLPVHKLRIVRAYKKKGNVVAMTGDGVNDAPAVKEADIGICMGGSGTDVTRQAAAMVLVDDSFATITEAVRQGRAIYANIRKFIRYMLACNLGEVITMFAGVLMGLPLPLYPLQILWVNLVTDGLPGIALGLDPPDEDVMRHPPISATAGFFTIPMVFRIIFRGILTGFCTLGAFISVMYTSGSEVEGRSAAFLTLVLIQMVYAFECRSDTRTLFETDLRENNLLIISVGIAIIFMAAVLYIPALQIVFCTAPLALGQLPIVLGFVMIGPLADSVRMAATRGIGAKRRSKKASEA